MRIHHVIQGLVLASRRFQGWLAGGLADCWLAGWLAGCLLAGWPAGWLAAGWLAGWLAGCWLAGWVAGWPSQPVPDQRLVGRDNSSLVMNFQG